MCLFINPIYIWLDDLKRKDDHKTESKLDKTCQINPEDLASSDLLEDIGRFLIEEEQNKKLRLSSDNTEQTSTT